PWSFTPDFNPTAQQIRRYLEDAVVALQIDVRLQHTVMNMDETSAGWAVTVQHAGKSKTIEYDYVIIASGQYTGRKAAIAFPGQSTFNGNILTELQVESLDVFTEKRVAVVGFGKSALDMVTFAARHHATEVHHIFRTPRWTVPSHIMGIHYTHPFFSRVGSIMMPSWAHPTHLERFLHHRLRFIISFFWVMLTSIFRLQRQMHTIGKGSTARKRMEAVLPEHSLLLDLRSASALAPDDYYAFVTQGRIQPHHTELKKFTETGIQLGDDSHIACDVVLLALGSTMPRFPYLPDTYRQLLESSADGVQLYRHLVHPLIPNLGFAGFNHGFMHYPAVEVGTLWLSAVIEGEMTLPSVEAMLATIKYIEDWKRDYIHFEPSRLMAVNTRFQQYLDIILLDMTLSPYRKSNIFAEIFSRYTAADYAEVLDEYENMLLERDVASASLHPLPVHT
ncbi:MAG: FAD-dependent oxidoreductase, partial [Aggregatilineales bacterium]